MEQEIDSYSYHLAVFILWTWENSSKDQLCHQKIATLPFEIHSLRYLLASNNMSLTCGCQLNCTAMAPVLCLHAKPPSISIKTGRCASSVITDIDVSAATQILQLTLLVDLFASLHQLATVQCNLPEFTQNSPSSGSRKRSSLSMTISSSALTSNSARLSRVWAWIRNQATQLVEVLPSEAVLASLKSAVLRPFTVPSYWAQDKPFWDLLVEGRHPRI